MTAYLYPNSSGVFRMGTIQTLSPPSTICTCTTHGMYGNHPVFDRIYTARALSDRPITMTSPHNPVPPTGGRRRSGGKTISHFGREFNTLRSAAQKYIRRNEYDNLVQIVLEIADSGHSRTAYQLLIKLAIEEKFPNGANHLPNMVEYLKIWNRLSLTQQKGEMTQMCYVLTQYPSDRYPLDIARVAMSIAKKPENPDALAELRMARSIECALLTIRKDNEMATPNDFISFDDGVRALRTLLGDFNADPVSVALFEHFERMFTKEARLESRPYLYNLMGRQMHKEEYVDATQQYARIPSPHALEMDERIVHDKNTTEGQRKKRGWKHFIAVMDETPTISDARRAIKLKADQIRLADERKHGTKASTPDCERKRIRDTFNEITALKGKAVLSTILCQKPCAQKPRTQYVHLEGDQKVFLKGPFKTREKLEFQLEMDQKKPEFGLTPMQIEILEEKSLFYLCAKVEHPYVNMVAGKSYSDDVIWELIRILIFRYAFNITDSTLRNVMIWTREEDGVAKSTLMSVDEMCRKSTPPREHGLMFQLFNVPPRKDFIDQVLRVIQERKEAFAAEVAKYGDAAKALVVA